MNELNVFSYEGKEVRTVQRNNETWWVLRDLCAVLDIANSRDAAARLDEDEKDDVGITDIIDRKQNTTVISESGLYNVIMFSRKPEAIKFKRWVTHEVLPSIRRHGLYAADELFANPDFLIRALEELKAERSKNIALIETVSIQKQQIAEMKPKASYYDVVLNCRYAVAVTTISKDYGKSAQWLNDYLHSLGIQFKQGKIWLLYQKYAENGYTCTKTHSYPGNDSTIHSSVHTYWTQKGRLFIYALLKSHGWLPLIEQGHEFEAV